MWCLCRFIAISRCSCEIKRTNASPLRRPCGDKHKATPPLECRKRTVLAIVNGFKFTQRCEQCKLYLVKAFLRNSTWFKRIEIDHKRNDLYFLVEFTLRVCRRQCNENCCFHWLILNKTTNAHCKIRYQSDLFICAICVFNHEF